MRRPRLFGASNSSAVELDLRVELNRTFFGANDELAKGRFFILRKMRRIDGVVTPVKPSELLSCSCRDNISHEADKDYECGICDGEGYLFDDIVVAGYRADRFGYQDVQERMQQSIQSYNTPFIYIEHERDISKFDFIIDPVLDSEGNIIHPIRERERYNIHYAEAFRSDSGRIEYWRLSCFTD